MTQKEVFAHRDALFERASIVMVKKNHDYGDDRDPFANFSASIAVGIDPKLGILIRMIDKISRLGTFVQRGTLATNGETADDALIDICNYAALFYAKKIDDERGALSAAAPKLELKPDPLCPKDSGYFNERVGIDDLR